MISCDPNDLMAAAKCYRCIPKGSLQEVMIYLICQWANGGPPVPQFSYEPPTAQINWTDANGNFGPVDRATFFATADIASVSDVNLDNQGVTSITAPQALPALINFSTRYNATNSLTFVGCANLQLLRADLSGITFLTVSNCPGLISIQASSNLFTTMSVGSLTALNFANFSSGLLTIQAVNTILTQLVALGNTGGLVNLSLQTPAAPPSVGPPDGIAAKAALLAEVPPWAVATD